MVILTKSMILQTLHHIFVFYQQWMKTWLLQILHNKNFSQPSLPTSWQAQKTLPTIKQTSNSWPIINTQRSKFITKQVLCKIWFPNYYVLTHSICNEVLKQFLWSLKRLIWCKFLMILKKQFFYRHLPITKTYINTMTISDNNESSWINMRLFCSWADVPSSWHTQVKSSTIKQTYNYWTIKSTLNSLLPNQSNLV